MTAEPHAPLGRGEFLAQAGAIGAGVAGVGLATLIPKSAAASVQFETERYGDKELKIATVNKLRQQIRNVVRKRGIGRGREGRRQRYRW